MKRLKFQFTCLATLSILFFSCGDNKTEAPKSTDTTTEQNTMPSTSDTTHLMNKAADSTVFDTTKTEQNPPVRSKIK